MDTGPEVGDSGGPDVNCTELLVRPSLQLTRKQETERLPEDRSYVLRSTPEKGHIRYQWTSGLASLDFNSSPCSYTHWATCRREIMQSLVSMLTGPN